MRIEKFISQINHVEKKYLLELRKRIKAAQDVKTLPLSDLCTIIRTLEAIKRSHFAIMRTLLAGVTVFLAALGLSLAFIKFFLL